MTRTVRIVVAVVACSLALSALVLSASPARAQTDPAPPTTLDQPTTTFRESDGMIPRPNSGVEPEDAGDRGGALQQAVFVLVLIGLGVIGVLVVRASRKARADRGF